MGGKAKGERKRIKKEAEKKKKKSKEKYWKRKKENTRTTNNLVQKGGEEWVEEGTKERGAVCDRRIAPGSPTVA